MKQKLKSGDYDSYEILIPAGHMFGKKKQDYIYKELEKRHPCFSENFVFDENTRITKKGFLSNVTVMDRYVLGDYKNRYPKSSFFTEENIKVFNSGWKSIVVLVLFLILFCVSLIFLKFSFIQDNPEPGAEEKPVPVFTEPQRSIVEDLFFDITESGGKIKSFQWVYDGFTENVSLNITDCSPADFDYSLTKYKISFSPVVFDKGIAVFSIEGEHKAPGTFEKNIKTTRKEFFNEMNIWFAEQGFLLKSEDYLSGIFSLSFSRNIGKYMFALSQKADEIYEKYGFSVYKVILNKNQVELGFTDDFEIPFEENFFSIFARINPCFYEAAQIKSEKKKIQKEPEKENTSRKRIGVITHENGNKSTFYKNRKGRIEND